MASDKKSQGHILGTACGMRVHLPEVTDDPYGPMASHPMWTLLAGTEECEQKGG